MLGTGTGNSHLSLSAGAGCWRCVCVRECVCAHPKYLLLLLRPLSQSGASAMCTSFCPGLWLCLRASACLIYKLARAFCLIPYNKLNKSGTCRHLFHQSLRAHTQHTHTLRQRELNLFHRLSALMNIMPPQERGENGRKNAAALSVVPL